MRYLLLGRVGLLRTRPPIRQPGYESEEKARQAAEQHGSFVAHVHAADDAHGRGCKRLGRRSRPRASEEAKPQVAAVKALIAMVAAAGDGSITGDTLLGAHRC
nr:hypothetical protein JVH1_0704 [Rhodococcus sp. JVH1]